MSLINAHLVSKSTPHATYIHHGFERGDRRHPFTATMAKQFDYCSRRWRNGYESPESDAKTQGSLLDVQWLTPEQFPSLFSIQPAKYETEGMKCPSCGTVTDSKRCKACGCDRIMTIVEKPWSNQSKTCSEWTEAQVKAGREVVTPDEMADVSAEIARLDEDPIIHSFRDASDVQVMIVAEWHDKPTGLVIPVQILVDMAPRMDTDFHASLGDLKRVRAAAPWPWASSVEQYGHALQAGLYLDVWNAAFPGEQRDTFCWILSEGFAPWQTARRFLDAKDLAIAQSAWRRIIGNYCWCLKNDKWPDYDIGEEGREVYSGWRKVTLRESVAIREMNAPKFGEPLPASSDDDLDGSEYAQESGDNVP